jgi:hypothetical protein
MKKRNRLFIIHFQPLELFPPAMNMIDFLSKEKDIDLLVSTNKKPNKNSLLPYKNEEVKIFRPTSISATGLLQYLNYVSFYITSLAYLLWHRPETVLYIETLSSWPAIIYKKIRGKRLRLMVHYHEYTEPRLYREGMLLSKWMHRIELRNYKKYSWFSHTNPVRLKMFKDDGQLNHLNSSFFHVIPNYPSKSWLQNREKDFSNKRTRLVFVGSLGYKNMYLQEVIDWLSKHRNEFSLDVYSYNIDKKAKEVLENSVPENIRYRGGCDYQSLPGILAHYEIGLVIYKPFSQNTIHAVSNKVFEYLACGLDVWFSEDMGYTFKYVRETVFPKVIPVNFKQLSSFDYESAITRQGLKYEPSHFFYEEVYSGISSHILNQQIQ